MLEITKPTIVPKKWGREIVIDNNNEYCGKILEFKKGESFANHFHLAKRETWYVLDGLLLMKHYNLTNADVIENTIFAGEVIKVNRGEPHKLTALEDSRIVEISTTHYDSDSFRIEKGSSQTS
jgi:quercetin dioxygenase-like cupin family protein